MKIKNKIALYIFIPLLLIGFLVWKFGMFNISSLEIASDQLKCTNTEAIKDGSGLIGQSIFLIDFPKTEKKLIKKFVCIKSVSFSKKLPGAVKMDISARLPFAKIFSLKDKVATSSAESIKEQFVIDDEGVDFEKEGENIWKVYVFEPERIIPNLVKILSKLNTFNAGTGEVFVEDFTLTVSGNPKIIFDLKDGIEVQLASLQLILNEAKINNNSLEFIDLRFDKPIVKYASKK